MPKQDGPWKPSSPSKIQPQPSKARLILVGDTQGNPVSKTIKRKRKRNWSFFGAASNTQMMPVTFIEFFGLLRRKKLNKYKQSSIHIILQWKCQAEPPWSCIMYSYLFFLCLIPRRFPRSVFSKTVPVTENNDGTALRTTCTNKVREPAQTEGIICSQEQIWRDSSMLLEKTCLKSMATVEPHGLNLIML